jgi:predicted permease
MRGHFLKESEPVAVSQAILPIFMLIVLGYVLGRRKALTAESTKALSNLAFKLFLPMVLFTGMLRHPCKTAWICGCWRPILFLRC